MKISLVLWKLMITIFHMYDINIPMSINVDDLEGLGKNKKSLIPLPISNSGCAEQGEQKCPY